ncbi:hypothetical protein ABZ591_34195 [Micromonospora fulviviridis]|uniref:hypothetical protein n=1 Tax=Micromonospora fulviviridis TaxID=47860 RepID=UPI0033F5D355
MAFDVGVAVVGEDDAVGVGVRVECVVQGDQRHDVFSAYPAVFVGYSDAELHEDGVNSGPVGFR